MALTPQTIRRLTQAGWSAERAGSTCDAAFEAAGVRLHDKARDFLARFGGVFFARYNQYHSGTLAGHTDAEEALRHVSRDRLERWEAETGAPLAPVGQSGYGYFIILMDADGYGWLGGERDELLEFASDADDMINSLCSAMGEAETRAEALKRPRAKPHPD